MQGDLRQSKQTHYSCSILLGFLGVNILFMLPMWHSTHQIFSGNQRQDNRNSFKNFILLISHDSYFKKSSAQMAHQESSSAYIVCCCWIYAIVSADLSYEINKGGGVLAAMGRKRSRKWVILWTYSVHCITRARPLAFLLYTMNRNN